MLKEKKHGASLEIRTFQGQDDCSYLVLRTTKGSYHVFVEVEAKQAARECGATVEDNTRKMWEQVWNQS